MQRQLNVRISDVQIEALDEAVASGRFPSRAAALRTALDLLLGHELQAPVEPVAEVPAGEAPPGEPATDAADHRDAATAADGAADGADGAEEPTADGTSGGSRAGEPAEVVRVVPPGARWLPERFLPTPAQRPALVLARRAAVPLISSAAGALLATVVRGGVTRRGLERSPRRRGDAEAAAARGTLDLLIVRGRDQAIGVGIRRP